MLKYLLGALVATTVAVAGFAGLAQAHYGPGKRCAMTITKGGCPVWIPEPGPQLPKPPGK